MVAWKPKEVEIPFEDALDAAKLKLKTQWINTPPPFCALEASPGQYEIFPFEQAYFKNPLVVIFIDPTSTSGEYILKQVAIFEERYGDLPIRLIIVFKVSYQSLSDIAFFERILRENDLRVHTYIDIDGSVAKAFQVKEYPDVVISSSNETENLIQRKDRKKESDWLNAVETMIQNRLRATDPGLPLFPALTHPDFKLRETIDLKPNDSRIKVTGTIVQQDDYFIINHSDTNLTLSGALPHFFIIAGSSMQNQPRCRVSVEVDGAPVFQQFAGEDVTFEDNGSTSIFVREPKIYRVLKNFKKAQYQLKLSFPSATQVPVHLFGLRFS